MSATQDQSQDAVTSSDDGVIHHGQCHCGQVKIAFKASQDLVFTECNCSICYILGLIGIDIPRSNLVSFEGKGNLREYSFNKKIARHWFCETCGASPLHIPRSAPDGYCVHFRCLDKSTIRSYEIIPFDGQNWEASLEKEQEEKQKASRAA